MSGIVNPLVNYPLVRVLRDNVGSCSFVLAKNGELMISHFPEAPRPLASIIKIPVMLEFVRQMVYERLDSEEQVPIEDLNRHYIPGSDNKAHEKWLSKIRSHPAYSGHVSLWQVMIGMMKFSSNANHDYLLQRLGLDNINQRLSGWIDGHEPCFPVLSSIAILNKHQNLIRDQSRSFELTRVAFAELARQHFIRINSPGGDGQKPGRLPGLGLQEIWSDLFPRASALAYLNLVQRINHQQFESAEIGTLILSAFDWILNEKRYRGYVHAGEKTGYTCKVFNKVLFAKKNNGETLEMVCFADGLTLAERDEIYHSDNAFTQELLTTDGFCESLSSFLIEEASS